MLYLGFFFFFFFFFRFSPNLVDISRRNTGTCCFDIGSATCSLISRTYRGKSSRLLAGAVGLVHCPLSASSISEAIFHDFVNYLSSPQRNFLNIYTYIKERKKERKKGLIGTDTYDRDLLFVYIIM